MLAGTGSMNESMWLYGMLFPERTPARIPDQFSTLEIIFCAFLAENYFVKVLIPFIGVRQKACQRI